jgi:hypothetical protein
MRPRLIAGADIDTEQPQQLAPTTHQRPVQRFHPHGRHPPHGHDLGFGAREHNFRERNFRGVEAAPMLDSSRHADEGNRAAGLLVDCLDSVVCSALI